MGQILHGCAKTTEAVRQAIRNSQESLRVLGEKYGLNPKTVSKWRKRPYVSDSPMGPKEAKSTVLKNDKHDFPHIFDRVCYEHKLTKVNHPRTNGQLERMNRTLKDATVKHYHYKNHQ